MPPTSLTGTLAPSRPDRVVETAGAEVRFSHDLGAEGFREIPGLIATTRDFTDPTPKSVSLSAETLGTIDSLESLEKAVGELFEANKDHLEATEIENKNEKLGVAGLRKFAFYDAARKALGETKLPADQLAAATALLTKIENQSFMNRDIAFDTGKLDTYHPYGSPFDKGVKKIEALAPPGVEKDAITSELNYITDRKTKKGWGSINERDAETTLGLRPIDRGNNDQSLSLAKDIADPRRPSYVVINVNTDGLPEAMAEHAGKAVIRDGDKLFFDKTSEEVPAELAEHLTEKAASTDLGLRLMESGETKRSDFPYDWNKNQGIDLDKIDTSWWGHCHIEAPLAALKLSSGSAVTMFDARSKGESTFNSTDVNDLLFALYDADRYADINSNRGASADAVSFVGNRNDTIGGRLPGDKVFFDVNGRTIPFNVRLKEISDLEDPEKTVDIDASFQPTVVSEGINFEANPAFLGIRDQDWSKINGDRKIVAEVEFMDVSSTGDIQRKTESITIDLKNPAEEPVILGSEIMQGSYPPNVRKFFLNEKTGNIESQVFAPNKKEDGSYEMVATSEEASILGKVGGTTLSRELTKESIIELHDHFVDAARRGLSFVTEKSPGHSVWNYGTDGFRMDVVEEDGEFTKYKVSVNTQGGNRSWEYIIKSDANGNAVDAHAMGVPADFLWRSERSVALPLFKSDNGAILYNSAAYERGYLVDNNGQLNNEGFAFFRYASDVVYASLKDPTKEKQFVIIDENGDLFFYESEEAYKADVAKVKGDDAE